MVAGVSASGWSESQGAIMERLTTIELAKEYLKFSAAHFTIFSATERERLHGHNFRVAAELTAPVGENGMCFSYKVFKRKLQDLCDSLDEYLLLPANSPYLEISEEGNSYIIYYGGERMSFLKSDTRLLPMRNATVEEYAQYLLEQLLADVEAMQTYAIRQILIKVSSGPGQWGSSTWKRDRPAVEELSDD